MMTTKVGVWVDHKDAFLMWFEHSGERTLRVESDVQRQLRRGGDRTDGPFESQAVVADDVQLHKFTGELDRYYDHLIETIGDYDELYLFGPGEAKGELKKRLETTTRVGTKVIEVETADRMTDPQRVAQARKHFAGA